MQIESTSPWLIMPGDRILHRTEGAVQVTFIQPDGTGGTYFDYYDRYGLPETFRCGPFDQVLKVVDRVICSNA